MRPRFATRLFAWLRVHPALLAAAGTLVLAFAALVAIHTVPRLAVPRAIAVRHVLADPSAARMLAATHWQRSDVTPIDGHYEVLGFYRGSRLVATIGVRRFQGSVLVEDETDLSRQRFAFGSNIANDVRVLAMLSVVFILMTAVWPLWRLRNLDVLVAASSVLSIVLFNRFMLDRMVLVSYPAMAYLAVRCAWWALGSRTGPAPAVPLYDRLTQSWTSSRQRRTLRLIASAAALVVVMVGLSSLHVLDVGYALMEGATAITHGLLPYGHIADVVHGDTYPIGSYLLYVPFAWLSPVHTQLDNADFTLAVAVGAALLAAWGVSRLVTAGVTSQGDRGTAGLRMAIAWMTFPPLLVTASAGTSDVVLAAMLVGALVLWRHPAGATAVLASSAWFKLAPVALLPMWLARLRGRALLRATVAIAVISAIMLGALLALGGVDAPGRMLSAISFQFTRASSHTLWALVGSVPLQQLTEAATLALIVGVAVRMRWDRRLADDRFRFAALSAAVLLGLQLSSNYWNYMYLVWILPFLVISLLEARGSNPETPSELRDRVQQSSRPDLARPASSGRLNSSPSSADVDVEALWVQQTRQS
jgi:hypothetical protein